MTKPHHMEKARDIEFEFDCDWTADGRRRGEAEKEAAIVAIASALAAAEQRGREEAARECENAAERWEVLEFHGRGHEFRQLAAAIRRGTP